MVYGSALLAATFAAYGSADSPTAATTEAGKALYTTQCRKCHGDEGQGNPAIYKMTKATLVHLGSKEAQEKSDADIKRSIVEGFGKMKPVTGLTGPQADQVVAYVRNLRLEKSGSASAASVSASSAAPAGAGTVANPSAPAAATARPSAPSPSASVGNAAAGQALYAAQCRKCHGDQGQGNPAMYRLVKATVVHLGSREAQDKPDETIRKSIVEGVGKMKPVSGLTTQQANDLVAFMRTLKQP